MYLLLKNKQAIKIALAVIAVSVLLLPVLPLARIFDHHGVSAALGMLMMLVTYAALSASWMPFGSHAVRVKKIIDPVTVTVIHQHVKTPLKLYGVVAPHPKQEAMYAESLAFIQGMLNKGNVQIKAMPESYHVNNQRVKFSRILVDGVDLAEEALRQGMLWRDPNFAVLRSYRDAENEGMTWNRGQFKGLRDGSTQSPFRFTQQILNAKQEESRRNLFIPKKEKAQLWGS